MRPCAQGQSFWPRKKSSQKGSQWVRSLDLSTPMPSWGEIHEIDFTYDGGKYIDLFTCSGKCDRKLRPLSCRIFPLVPYAKQGGKLEILMDVRGRGMCPLATAMHKEDLSGEFVRKVTDTMKLCMAVRETREFIYALSDSLDEIKLLEEDFHEL